MRKSYAIIYRRGPAWIAGKGISGQPLRPHGDYMHSLYSAGKLVMGGPFADDSGGLAIILAGDDEEAHKIMVEDPAVTGEVFAAELHPWSRVDWESYSLA